MEVKQIELIRLLPDQVADLWDFLKGKFEAALGGLLPIEALNNVLTALFIGNVDCWVLKVKGNYKCAVLTSVFQDKLLGTRHLYIHTLTSIGMSKAEWEVLTESLINHAKGQELKSILFTTNVVSLAGYVRGLGGTVTNLIELEV